MTYGLTAPVYGELSADGQTIVLVAGGTDIAAIERTARWLTNLTPLLSRSDPPGALTLPATWPAVVQLAKTFGDNWQPSERLVSWVAAQIKARTDVSPTPFYVPPDGLSPYPWQSSGASLIAATGKALITDEPGTGKTVTAILGLLERMETGEDFSLPAVVVCPASVVDSWVEHWQTWAPDVRTVAWRGSPAKRHALAGKADVYVTSYDIARMDAATTRKGKQRALLDLEPRSLVIDECHLIKSHTAMRSLAVRRIAKRCDNVVALSGTPITHHPGDLWPTLDALEHDAWPARERWAARYLAIDSTQDYGEGVLGLAPHAEPEFRLTLLGQERRVAKADCLELPEKVYSVRTVELPAKWRKAYDEFESQMLAELPDDGGELAVMDVLTKFGHLSRLASAPADVEVTYETRVNRQTGEDEEVQHVHLDLKHESWKVRGLLEVLDERPGQPVVAFAPSRQLTMLAGEAATDAGLRVGYIVGGQTPKERTANVERFQAGALDLICATTGAGGVGITLTAARTAVFLQRPWSLVDSIQAEDRIHRIGAERHSSVEIMDIVASNTVDTRIRSVLRNKAGQLADLVRDPRIVAELLGGASVTRLQKVS